MGYGAEDQVAVDGTIASGASESSVFDTRYYKEYALEITSTSFTGTTITVKGCRIKDGTFNDIYDDDGNQVSISVPGAAAGDRAPAIFGIDTDRSSIAAVRYLKFVSGGTEAAKRDLVLHMKS